RTDRKAWAKRLAPALEGDHTAFLQLYAALDVLAAACPAEFAPLVEALPPGPDASAPLVQTLRPLSPSGLFERGRYDAASLARLRDAIGEAGSPRRLGVAESGDEPFACSVATWLKEYVAGGATVTAGETVGFGSFLLKV